MKCKMCKYYELISGYCLLHGTKQRKNAEKSCGEYTIQDKDGNEIDGKSFYFGPN
jgi:hypothetical protein